MSEYNDNDKYWIGEVLTKEDVNEIWQHILDLLKVNGGEGSEINADMLDGHHASYFISKDEMSDSMIQPGFFVGRSPLKNERNPNKQFLLTTDILPSGLTGAGSVEGITLPTDYGTYFKTILYDLLQYQSHTTNLDTGDNIDPETYLPYPDETIENPDKDEKINNLINILKSGYEDFNTESGGYNFDEKAITYYLTKIINDIIVSICVDFLSTTNHEDRILQIEKLLNKHYSIPVQNMIDHLITYNFGEVTYIQEGKEFVDYKFNADSVNGIQLILITQSDYNELDEDIKNNWRYLFIIKEDGSIPSEYLPSYITTGSSFSLFFKTEAESENIVWLKYATYKDEPERYQKLIPIIDKNYDEETSEQKPIITKELLEDLLDGEYVKNIDDGTSKTLQEKINEIISKLPSEFFNDSTISFDGRYEHVDRKVSTLDGTEVNYPNCSAISTALEDYQKIENLDNIIDKDSIDETHYPSSQAVVDFSASKDHTHSNYVSTTTYENDLKVISNYLSSILGV